MLYVQDADRYVYDDSVMHQVPSYMQIKAALVAYSILESSAVGEPAAHHEHVNK